MEIDIIVISNITKVSILISLKVKGFGQYQNQANNNYFNKPVDIPRHDKTFSWSNPKVICASE